MTTIEEHLLACLIEECAEVQKHCTKSLRFGIDDRDPTIEGAATERTLLAYELDDLLAVRELCVDMGVITENRNHRDYIEAKKRKVMKYLDYAREHHQLLTPTRDDTGRIT